MLYYKATAGCGVGMFVGVSARRRAAPVTLILGRVAALLRAGARRARVNDIGARRARVNDVEKGGKR
jgi:hypothetical protein